MIDILTVDKGRNRERMLLTGSQLQQLRQARPVERVAAWQSWDLPMTSADLPEDVRATFLTSNASAYFGVPPLLGRGLIPADAPEGGAAQPVAILSYSFWQRHFHASRGVLGKTIELLRKRYSIVGVFPPRFSWTGADVYLPLQIP
ncbi:MAG TPA: ABC transporter permease, partial [Bryobacteraceae bacterium]|nr:ABC transporter permease [Bryobacteraceae bacterium]